MVRTKSVVASDHVADNPDTNSSTAWNNGRSECLAESVRLGSTSYSNSAGANAAARISKSRAEGRADDY